MIKVMIGKKEMYVRGDSNQWSLGKMVYNKKEDKEVFLGESFWSSTEGMIRGLLEKKLRSADANSLTELQMALRTAKDELAGMYEV